VAGDTVRSDYPGAHDIMRRLATVGIDMEEVTQHLLDAGGESFAASYNALVRVIAEKADAMAGGLGSSQHLDLGASTKPIIAEAESAAASGLVRRIWERDPDAWVPGDAEHAAVIRNRLGWLDIVETMGPQLAGLRTFAEEVRDDGVRDVVLLGMGGSSLCPEV